MTVERQAWSTFFFSMFDAAFTVSHRKLSSETQWAASMSGFEVVGLTLAAIPLVIEALEQYRGRLGLIKGFRETEANAKYILVDLQF
jgi:hypothetical protein